MTKTVDLPGRYGWRESQILPAEFFETAPAGPVEYLFTGSGGANTGGAAAIARTIIALPSGGVVTGGAAVTSKSVTFTHVASGGVITGGAAAISTTVAPPASGNVATGGAATLARTWAVTGAGGVTAGGSAAASFSRAVQTAGGVTTSGAAGVVVALSAVGSGGVVVGGAALVEAVLEGEPPVEPPVEPGNTVSGGGFTPLDWLPLVPVKQKPKRPALVVKIPAVVFEHVGSGGVSVGGAADAAEAHPQVAHEFAGSGGVVLGGAAHCKFISPVLIAPRDAEDLLILSMMMVA